MRGLMIGTAMIVTVFASERVQAAVDYPWCAHYGNAHGGVNCGFVSYAQCRETISGNGGFCAENPFYRNNPPPRVRKSPRPER